MDARRHPHCEGSLQPARLQRRIGRPHGRARRGCPARPPARGPSRHAVGGGGLAEAVGDHQGGAARERARRPPASSTLGAGAARLGGGLVEHDDRRGRPAARGPGRAAGPGWRRARWPPSPTTRVEAVGERRDPGRGADRARARRAAPRRWRRAGPGAGRRRACPAKTWISWVTSTTAGRVRRRGRGSVDGDPADVTEPDAGCGDAGESRPTVVLPAPVAPTSATRSPGGDRRGQVRQDVVAGGRYPKPTRAAGRSTASATGASAPGGAGGSHGGDADQPGQARRRPTGPRRPGTAAR